MAEHDDPLGIRSDTSRAGAFADGVFAIVITLLVLDLRPPHVPPGQLLRGLLAQWPSYLAYVTSYLYVAVVWLNHKASLSRIRLMDPFLHWANLGILFTTALLPFPTAVISEVMEAENSQDVRVAVALYALVGVMLCASWVVFFQYLKWHPEFVKEGVGSRFFKGETKRAWAGVALYAAAGVLGYLVAPWIGLVIFLVVPVFYGMTSHGWNTWGRHRRWG
jgi:uncharacterized membrane protein